MTVACLLLTVGLIGVEEPPSESVSDQQRGAYCLFIALKALGEKLGRFEEFEASLPKPGPSGHTADELSKFAADRGLHTLTVETSLENLGLRDRGFCCITAITSSHYVLLYDADDERVFLVDPPDSKQLLVDGFKAVWSRKCLLISRSPLQREEDLGRTPLVLRVLIGLAALVAALALVFLVFRASSRLRNRRRIATILMCLAPSLSILGRANGTHIKASPAGTERSFCIWNHQVSKLLV